MNQRGKGSQITQIEGPAVVDIAGDIGINGGIRGVVAGPVGQGLNHGRHVAQVNYAVATEVAQGTTQQE